MNKTQNDVDLELARAIQARANNNEGQARVCARRAAGIAIREYLQRHGNLPVNRSAYDLLNFIKEEPALPPHLKLFAHHLTLRVTEEFTLPENADLIEEARILCAALIEQSSES